MWSGVRDVIRTTLSLSAVAAAAALAHVLVMAGPAAPSSGPAPASTTTLCHKPGTPAQQTVEVESSAVPGHLGHGDTIGACGAPPTTPPPPTVPPTVPPTSPPTTPPTVPGTAPPGIPPPGIPPAPPPVVPPDTPTDIDVAGASAIRTDSSEVGRALVAGEAVRIVGTVPDGCRPQLRVDGDAVGSVDVGRDGSFGVDVATDDLSAGRHVAEVVCGAGVVARRAFWIAAPVTSTEIFSVGMLAMLTLGGLGWVGIKTVRDATFGDDVNASSADE